MNYIQRITYRNNFHYFEKTVAFLDALIFDMLKNSPFWRLYRRVDIT